MDLSGTAAEVVHHLAVQAAPAPAVLAVRRGADQNPLLFVHLAEHQQGVLLARAEPENGTLVLTPQMQTVDCTIKLAAWKMATMNEPQQEVLLFCFSFFSFPMAFTRGSWCHLSLFLTFPSLCLLETSK